MEEKLLKDICDLKSGSTPRRNKKKYWENGTIPWAKISDLETSSDGYIYDTEEHITKKGLESINNRFFKKGTLLFAMYGSVGKTAIANIDLTMNQAILGINIKDEDKVDLKYLRYWLSVQKDKLLNRAVGATLKNLSKTIVGDLEIPLPPLKTQKSIAARLDQAEAVKQLNQQLLAKYDALAQSVFLEMFGDPVLNEKGWEVKKLGKLTSKIGSGATPRGGEKAYREEGIPLIRSLNIHDDNFKYDNLAFIDEDQAYQLRNVIVKENDVLFNITGASVCRAAIVPSQIVPARVNQHVAILRCKQDVLLPKYLLAFLISPSKKAELLHLSRTGGATREAINKGQLEALEIKVPPLSLQTEFARRIENIEHQKSLLRLEIAKSEELFESLLQESFDFNKPAVTV